MEIHEIKYAIKSAVTELIEVASLKKNDLLVVGCSSSEITGHQIGSFSSEEIGEAVAESILLILKERGVFLAAQCCEHLNRALILEREAAEYYQYEIVNVVPKPKAGGSFATAVYAACQSPVAVEKIQAKAGIDIGDTIIGMHLAQVAVPVRLKNSFIGQAHVVYARTRPKYIGGERAAYQDNLR